MNKKEFKDFLKDVFDVYNNFEVLDEWSYVYIYLFGSPHRRWEFQYMFETDEYDFDWVVFDENDYQVVVAFNDNVFEVEF